MNVTFTFDLEDHRPNDNYSKNYPQITHDVLTYLDENQVKGTFFVVGDVAKEDPTLITDISDAGHEIAFHSMSHVTLNLENRKNFSDELHLGKILLEDLTGKAVCGFRAPVFSLTKQTSWALDILLEEGFTYSSSILPAKNILHGYPGAPAYPYYWKNGLLELPASVTNFCGLTFPFLGGVYLRYLPKYMFSYFLNNCSDNKCMWTYCHPYDFDVTEPFFRMKGTSWIVSSVLWFNRKRTKIMLDHLFNIMKDRQTDYVPFIEQITRGDFSSAPYFNQ